MFDITPIIEALALLIAAVITAVVIPLVRSKTTAQQQQDINSWVKVAVLAAEQIFVGTGRGEEKKAHVLNFLAEHGVRLDEARVDALIEAAVFEMKNGIIKSE